MTADELRRLIHWSEPARPNDRCSYDHVVAQTPIGTAQIEWKGWKDYPGFVAYVAEEFLSASDTLDEAKDAVLAFLQEKAAALVPFLDAGWRPVPAEGGPEWEEMVQRALDVKLTTWRNDGESDRDLERRHQRRVMKAALRAALNPQQEPDHGA